MTDPPIGVEFANRCKSSPATTKELVLALVEILTYPPAKPSRTFTARVPWQSVVAAREAFADLGYDLDGISEFMRNARKENEAAARAAQLQEAEARRQSGD